MFMEGKSIGNFFHNMKNKFKKEPKIDSSINEYAFNKNDLDELQKENTEKIQELKKEILDTKRKKQVLNEKELNETILNKAYNHEETKEEETPPEEQNKESSFINLEEEYQEIIMNKWNSIDMNEIDNDIIQGKDLLNHNYTITYTKDATKYIDLMRNKYEVIICYLIGFNNEKKGIYNKITFGDNPEDEWKYLNYYIKLLEKIRNFKIK